MKDGAVGGEEAAMAFGSRARGEARANSDLDLAVILHQPQLNGVEKMACWQRFSQALGSLGVGVDLVVAGAADAERLPLACLRGCGPGGQGAVCRQLTTRPCCWRSCAATCARCASAWRPPIPRRIGDLRPSRQRRSCSRPG
jgi:predicted nucleotidyltransferase